MKRAEWRIEFTKKAVKDLHNLGAVDRSRVLKFIHQRLAVLDDPKLAGKRLKGQLSEYWVYRVGAVRILTRHENKILVVQVIEVGNRREIYR